MGGALRASAVAENSVLLNPAGLTLARTYVVNAIYQFRVSDSASLVNASIIDSVTTGVAAGLFYSFSHASPTHVLATSTQDNIQIENIIQTHEAGLALGYCLSNMFHLGINARYVYMDVEQTAMAEVGGLQQAVTLPEAFVLETKHTATLDVGGIVRPWGGLSIGVVGHNLVPIKGPAFPIQLGLGLAYAFGTRFLAEFDSVLDFSRDETVVASFHGGGELFLADMVAVRAGVMHDMFREATYASGGLGLVTRKVGLDFGLRQMVDGGAETLIAFSVRLFVIQ